MKYRYLIIFTLCFITDLKAKTFYPEAIVRLDSLFSHHVLVAEKSTHRLLLFENQDGAPKLIADYSMATGKKSGDKVFQGDHRTPEGIYIFTGFLPHKELISKYGEEGKIYGMGAFVMDYPNPMDRIQKKTGGGIWLHSTNDETRIDKGLDSRGCVVTGNRDLIDIAKYIELNRTHIIVLDKLTYLDQTSFQLEKQKIEKTLEAWLKAWKDEDLKSYISHYHPTLFFDSRKGDYKEFKNYKKRVFYGLGKPEIKLTDISILSNGQYLKVTFRQHYKSETINDIGKKELYLARDQFYNWKIFREYWSSLEDEDKNHMEDGEELAFRPSMRFFKSYDVDQSISAKNTKVDSTN